MTNYHFAPDEFVVNYHDACIYGRDLALLDSPTEWLNDACIHFAFTELQVAHDQATAPPPHDNNNNNQPSSMILFFDPAVVSFLMHQCHDEDDYRDFCRGCRNFQQPQDHDMRRRHVLMIPINDTLTASHWNVPGMGSHWSLLVLVLMNHHHPHPDDDDDDEEKTNQQQRFVSTAVHLDSVRHGTGGNLPVAQAVADQIVRAASLSAPKVVVQCQSTPQQQNAYDCGVHVIAMAQQISERIFKQSSFPQSQDDLEKCFLDPDNSMPSCKQVRKELAQRIRQLASKTTGTRP